jgi:hypothetical protein
MRVRSKRRKALLLCSIIASLLLVLAQTSWWATFLINNSLQGTEFANMIWTIFNSIVPIIFVGYASMCSNE